jgi:hypothetical protein
MFVDHPTSDKRKHGTSPSAGLPLIFSCLHEDLLFLLLFILTILPSLYLFEIENINITLWARGSVVDTNRKVAGSIPDEHWIFLLT